MVNKPSHDTVTLRLTDVEENPGTLKSWDFFPIDPADEVEHENLGTDKKEKKICLVYKEIQMGAVA
jgi:hypothetical protein